MIIKFLDTSNTQMTEIIVFNILLRYTGDAVRRKASSTLMQIPGTQFLLA